jgi:AraC family transcriptional activator of pobA
MDGAAENLHFSSTWTGRGQRAMQNAYDVDTFFLYGEPARPAGARFAHLEYVDDRSRPANWRIRPHAHSDLHHIFEVFAGGGVIHADGVRLEFTAPQIIVAPAGAVHGFHWVPETNGRVLTFSDAFLRAITQRDPALSQMAVGGVWAAPYGEPRIGDAMSELARELSWQAAAHDLAVEAQLSIVLVETLRLRAKLEREAQAPPGPQALLVARYRQLIEERFREHPSVQWCAVELGVSAGRLRSACRTVAGASPVRMLQDRLALEAQRVMRYSNMTVGQVATYLGFSDPAYFSRFFTRECGSAPRRFRDKAGERVAS